MRWRLVCALASALLVLCTPLSAVSAAWSTSHDFGAGFIVTGMFTYRGEFFAMVHSYSGGGKAYFYRVTNVNADNTTDWEFLWATGSEYAELEHVVVHGWVPYYCVGRRVYYVSTGNDGRPSGFLDHEFPAYVADLAVHGGYVYAVTTSGSVYRSAGYGDWGPVGVAHAYGSFDWSLASLDNYLYASCPAGIWRSTDGFAFAKVCSGNIRELGVHAGNLWAYALNGSLYNSSDGLTYDPRGSVGYSVKDFCSYGDDLYIATAGAASGRVYRWASATDTLSVSDSLGNGAWCLYKWGENLYSGWGVVNAAPHGLVRVNTGVGYPGSPLSFKRVSVVPAGSTAAIIVFDLTHSGNYSLFYWKAFPASSVTSAFYRGSHEVGLTGLEPGSTYFYNITCFDLAGRRIDSGTLSFDTPFKSDIYIPVGGFSPYANFTDDYENFAGNDDLHNYTVSVTGDSAIVVSAIQAHGGVNSTRYYDNRSNTPDFAYAVRPLGGFGINGSLQSWIYLDNTEPWPYMSGNGGFWIELWESTMYPYAVPSVLVGCIRAAWYGAGLYGFFNSTDDFMQNAVNGAWHNITFWWRAADARYYVYINDNPYALDWDASPVKGVTHIIFRLNSRNMGEVNYRNAVYVDDVDMSAWVYESIVVTGSTMGVFDRIFSLRGDAFAALNNGTHGVLYRFNGSNWSVVQVFSGEIGDAAYDGATDTAYIVTSNRTHLSGIGGAIWNSTDLEAWTVVLNLSGFNQVNDGIWDGFELAGEGTGFDRWTFTAGAALVPDFEYPMGAMNVSEGQSCFILDDDPADWVYVQVDPAFSTIVGNTGYYQVFFFLGSPDGSYQNFTLMNNSEFWVYANSTWPGAIDLYSWNGTYLGWIPPIDAFGMTASWHNLTVYYNQMAMRVKVWLDGVLIDDGPTIGVAFTSMAFGTWNSWASGSGMFDNYREQEDVSFENPIIDCTYAVSVEVSEDGYPIAVFSNTPWNPSRQGSAVFLYNLTEDSWHLIYSGDPITKVVDADGNFWAGFSVGLRTPSGSNESFLVNLTSVRRFFDVASWQWAYSSTYGRFAGLSPSFVHQFPGAMSYVADMVSTTSRFHGDSQFLPEIIVDPPSVRSWLLVLNSSGGYMFGDFTSASFSSFFTLPDGYAPKNDEDRIGGDRLSVNGLDVFVATGSGVWRVYEGLSDLASAPVVFANDTASRLYALEWRGPDLLIGTVRNVTLWPCRWILFPIYAVGNNASERALVSVDGFLAQVVNMSTGAPYPHDAYYFFDAESLGDTFLDREYVCVQFVSHPGLGGGYSNQDVFLDALTMWGVRYYGMDGGLDFSEIFLAFYAVYDQNCTLIPIIVRGMNSLDPADNASVAFYYGVVNLSSTGWHVLSFVLDSGTSEEFPLGSGLSVAPSYWSHGNNVGSAMNASLSLIDHVVMTVVHPDLDTHFWFDARALGFYNYSNNYSWLRVDIPANGSAAARFCADKVLLRVNESGWYLDIWEGHSYPLGLLSHPATGGRDEFGIQRFKYFNWSIWFDEDLDPASSTKFGSGWFTTTSLAWMSDNSSIPVVWPGLSANLTILLSGRQPGGFLVVFEGNITANCATNDTNVSLDVYSAAGVRLANVANGTFNFTAGVLFNLTTLFGYPAGSEPNWTALALGNYYGNLSVWNGVPNLNLSFDTWYFTFGGAADPLNVSIPWIRDRDNNPFYTDDSLHGMLVASRIVSVNAVVTLQLGYRCATLNDGRWVSVSLAWQGNGTYYYVFSVPAQLHKGDVVFVYAYAVDTAANAELQNASYVIDWAMHEISTPKGNVVVYHEPYYSNGVYSVHLVPQGVLASYSLSSAYEYGYGYTSSVDFRQEGPGGSGRIRVVPPPGLVVIGVRYDGIYIPISGSMSLGRAVFRYDGLRVDIEIPLSAHDIGVVFAEGGFGGAIPEWDVRPDGPDIIRFPFGKDIKTDSGSQERQRRYVFFWTLFVLMIGLLLLLIMVLLLWGLTCWLTIFGLIVLCLVTALLVQIVPYVWLFILLFVSSIFFVLTRKSCKRVVCKVRYGDSPMYRRCVERARRSYWFVMPFFAQVALSANKVFYANYAYALAGLLGAYGLVMTPFLGYNYFGWRTEMPI